MRIIGYVALSVIGVFIGLGFWIGIEVGLIVHQSRHDEMVLTKQASNIGEQATNVLTLANSTLAEQKAYFASEQAFLQSKEIRTDLELGGRSLRNLDATTIALKSAAGVLDRTMAEFEREKPNLVKSLSGRLDAIQDSLSEPLSAVTVDLDSIHQQVDSIGMETQAQLKLLTPILQDLDLTIKSSNTLVANPDIPKVIDQAVGTMTNLNKTTANLVKLTTPVNILVQAGTSILQYTGIKWLSQKIVP